VRASLVLICDDSGLLLESACTSAWIPRVAFSFVLICGRSDPVCTTGPSSGGRSWTADSLVLIRGGSAPSCETGGVSSWTPRTVDSRVLIRRHSDLVAEDGSGLLPPDGVALPSLAVTASLVLILGRSVALGAVGVESLPAGAGGRSVSGPGSGAGGSWDGAWPLGLSLLSAFFFFRRFSIPRLARRTPPTAVSSILSPP